MRQGELDHLDVGHRLDRLPVTALHVAVVALCALGFSFDMLEIGLALPHACSSGGWGFAPHDTRGGRPRGAPLTRIHDNSRRPRQRARLLSSSVRPRRPR